MQIHIMMYAQCLILLQRLPFQTYYITACMHIVCHSQMDHIVIGILQLHFLTFLCTERCVLACMTKLMWNAHGRAVYTLSTVIMTHAYVQGSIEDSSLRI